MPFNNKQPRRKQRGIRPRLRNKNELNCKYSIFFVLLALLIGCASTHPIRELKKDIIDQKDGYQSLAFWRIRVIDRVNTFSSNNSKRIPKFHIYNDLEYEKNPVAWLLKPYKIGPNLGTDFFSGDTLQGGWIKRNGVGYLDELIVAELKPGDYSIESTNFYIDTYYDCGNTGITYFRVDNYFGFPTIFPDRMMYLGTFDIEFISKKRGTYTYNYNHNIDNQNFNKDLESFMDKYPKLYSQFKGKVDIYPYIVYDKFGLNSKRWPVTRDSTSCTAKVWQDEYLVDSKDTLSHWLGFTLPKDMPDNFDIELESRWQKGVNHYGHGITLGSDINNGYHFEVSGNGGACVWLYHKDEGPAETLIDWKDNICNISNGNITNVHKVEVRGDVIQYYINGKYIGTIKTIIKNFSKGYIGVSINNKQTVAFDNLKIQGK